MIRLQNPALRSSDAGPITAPSLPKPEPRRTYGGGKRSHSVTLGREIHSIHASPGRWACRSVHQEQQP